MDGVFLLPPPPPPDVALVLRVECRKEPELKIYTVAEWGGKLVDNRGVPTQPAVGIVIHHTAGANRKYWVGEGEPEQFERDKVFQLVRQIQRDHMRPVSQGGRIGARDSGHHFFVSRGGLVAEGRRGTLDAAMRGLVLQGAHSGNTVANGNRWGIEVEGLYTDEVPTPEQWRALVRLCAYLSLWGKTQAANLAGHREFKATQCPGDAFYAKLDDLKVEVRREKHVLLGLAAPQ